MRLAWVIVSSKAITFVACCTAFLPVCLCVLCLQVSAAAAELTLAESAAEEARQQLHAAEREMQEGETLLLLLLLVSAHHRMGFICILMSSNMRARLHPLLRDHLCTCLGYELCLCLLALQPLFLSCYPSPAICSNLHTTAATTRMAEVHAQETTAIISLADVSRVQLPSAAASVATVAGLAQRQQQQRQQLQGELQEAAREQQLEQQQEAQVRHM
jgi:hypothetical protein